MEKHDQNIVYEFSKKIQFFLKFSNRTSKFWFAFSHITCYIALRSLFLIFDKKLSQSFHMDFKSLLID